MIPLVRSLPATRISFVRLIRNRYDTVRSFTSENKSPCAGAPGNPNGLNGLWTICPQVHPCCATPPPPPPPHTLISPGCLSGVHDPAQDTSAYDGVLDCQHASRAAALIAHLPTTPGPPHAAGAPDGAADTGCGMGQA